MTSPPQPAIYLALLALAANEVFAPGSAVRAQTPAPANAESDDEAFARIVQTRWVLLDEQNGLDGAIGTFDPATGVLNPTTGITLELYDADAILARRVTTGADGRFRISDLEAGRYQCLAQSSAGFLAFSLFAIERGRPVGRHDGGLPTVLVQAPRQTQTRLDVLSAAVPPTYRQLNAILRLFYGRTTPTYVGQSGAATNNAALGDMRELQQAENGDRPALATASALQAYDVPLRDGNRIRGRLYGMDARTGYPVIVRDVYVHLIRNDELLGPPIPVNNEGVFEAELFDGPGVYSIVAAGRDGFGASSFYARRVAETAGGAVPTILVSARLAQNQGQRGLLPANPPPNAAPPFQFTMSLITDLRVLQQALPAADPFAAFAGPAATPLTAGGFREERLVGGGAMGGGGLPGALLLGGSLATGITALAVDGGTGLQVTSPFTP